MWVFLSFNQYIFLQNGYDNDRLASCSYLLLTFCSISHVAVFSGYHYHILVFWLLYCLQASHTPTPTPTPAQRMMKCAVEEVTSGGRSNVRNENVRK